MEVGYDISLYEFQAFGITWSIKKIIKFLVRKSLSSHWSAGDGIRTRESVEDGGLRGTALKATPLTTRAPRLCPVANLTI